MAAVTEKHKTVLKSADINNNLYRMRFETGENPSKEGMEGDPGIVSAEFS